MTHCLCADYLSCPTEVEVLCIRCRSSFISYWPKFPMFPTYCYNAGFQLPVCWTFHRFGWGQNQVVSEDGASTCFTSLWGVSHRPVSQRASFALCDITKGCFTEALVLARASWKEEAKGGGDRKSSANWWRHSWAQSSQLRVVIAKMKIKQKQPEICHPTLLKSN